MIKVFGHKSPDADATCAPISYAWFLKQKGQEAEAFVLGELNRETEFVLKTAGVEKPKLLEKLSEDDEVAIVDTNNPEELPDGINEASVKTIIDHHKLGGLKTESPVEIYMKPVGCSSTLVYQIMKENDITPSKEIATLLLSAILSDTLKFTSPTTTEDDTNAADTLAGICGLDMEKHSGAMFTAKSDLAGMSARDILMMDSKVFDFGGKKVRISVLETTKPENAKAKANEIKGEMEKVKSEEKLDAAYFFVVDIIKSSGELFAGTDEEQKFAESAFGSSFIGGYMNLPGVVSRKKQIVPAFEKVIS